MGAFMATPPIVPDTLTDAGDTFPPISLHRAELAVGIVQDD